MPAARISTHLEYLIERYQVGFIDVGDENFGSDRPVSKEVASALGALGLKWRAGGVRTSTINRDLLKHWKDNGCISVIYGMESGSQTMLNVMEKNTTVEQNLNALKLTHEAGLRTVVQLVVAMPGETQRTVRETIEFLKEASAYLYLDGGLPSSKLSVNYAQSLPGTPLYEYAREHGYIGRTIEAEESYLLKISDTDAYKEDHFINFTRQPLLKVLMWQQEILAEVDADYLRKRFNTRYSLAQVGTFYVEKVWARLRRRLARRFPSLMSGPDMAAKAPQTSGYFNIREAAMFTPLLLNPLTRVGFVPLLAVGMAFGKSGNPVSALRLLGEYIVWHFLQPFRAPLETQLPTKSLRKVVTILPTVGSSTDDKMVPLRAGR